MCIRDRISRVVHSDETDHRVRGGDDRHTAALFGGAPHRAAPVSYTHLRAHETVLDLVCRLLLEKKKKKLTQYNNVPINTLRDNKTAC